MQQVELPGHRHQDREPPENSQHGQGELLGTAKSKHHVSQVHERQRTNLPQGVLPQVREGYHFEELCKEELVKAAGRAAIFLVYIKDNKIICKKIVNCKIAKPRFSKPFFDSIFSDRLQLSCSIYYWCRGI